MMAAVKAEADRGKNESPIFNRNFLFAKAHKTKAKAMKNSELQGWPCLKKMEKYYQLLI